MPIGPSRAAARRIDLSARCARGWRRRRTSARSAAADEGDRGRRRGQPSAAAPLGDDAALRLRPLVLLTHAADPDARPTRWPAATSASRCSRRSWRARHRCAAPRAAAPPPPSPRPTFASSRRGSTTTAPLSTPGQLRLCLLALAHRARGRRRGGGAAGLLALLRADAARRGALHRGRGFQSQQTALESSSPTPPLAPAPAPGGCTQRTCRRSSRSCWATARRRHGQARFAAWQAHARVVPAAGAPPPRGRCDERGALEVVAPSSASSTLSRACAARHRARARRRLLSSDGFARPPRWTRAEIFFTVMLVPNLVWRAGRAADTCATRRWGPREAGAARRSRRRSCRRRWPRRCRSSTPPSTTTTPRRAALGAPSSTASSQAGPSRLGSEEARKLYPELLKRLDDASDGVRIAACADGEPFRAMNYSAVWSEGAPTRPTISTSCAASVHLDDPSPRSRRSRASRWGSSTRRLRGEQASTTVDAPVRRAIEAAGPPARRLRREGPQGDGGRQPRASA